MGYAARSTFEDRRGAVWRLDAVPGAQPLLPIVRALASTLDKDTPPDLGPVSEVDPAVAIGTGSEPGEWILSGPYPSSVRLVWFPPRGQWGPSSAVRMYLMAHKIRGLGFRAPRPLVTLQRYRRAARHPSVYVDEYVEAPDMVTWWHRTLLASRVQDRAAYLRNKRVFLDLVGRMLGTMYREGVSMDRIVPASLLVSDVDLAVTRDDLLVGRLQTLRRIRPRRDGLRRLLEELAAQRGRFIGFTRADDLRFLQGFFHRQAHSRTQARIWMQRLAAHADVPSVAGDPAL